MISRLLFCDVSMAASVFSEGLALEKPPGRGTLSSIEEHLRESVVFVYKRGGKIVGLVSAQKKGDDALMITFICALVQRKGIGRELMRRVAKYAARSGVRFIYSTVSERDSRAREFYKHCGFRQYNRQVVDYVGEKDLTLYKIKVEPKTILKTLSLRVINEKSHC